MLDRLMKLISGMLNKGMSKLETPEILAEQAQSQLEDTLKKLKDSMAESLTNEKILEKKISKSAEDLKTWQQRAQLAVQQNNDDVAKQCLIKKNELEAESASLASQLAQQKAATAGLKQQYADIEEKLREFSAKKSGLVSRAQGSDAVANANDLMSNPSSGMEKWEQKIIEKESMSEAKHELAQEDQAKIAASAQVSDVDNELAALKQQMSAGGPKLIEDKSGES